jgi:enterochelin esterase-like enzyme
VIKTIHHIKSAYLSRTVQLEIYLPQNLLGNEQLHLLLLNDGQDAEALHLQETLNTLHQQHKIKPLLTVAIKASEDRLQEYGVAGRPDFKGRGSKAGAYTDFVVKELLPFVEKAISHKVTGSRAIAGFSLGGLSAFDIAFNNPRHFDQAGVFSGSFWWRKKDLADGYTDDDRILHAMVGESKIKPDVKFWLMTGTEDETADRNQNGIIDSIDDTIDVVKALKVLGFRKPEDVFYYEMVGGQHNPESWSEALPAFLIWAFKF